MYYKSRRGVRFGAGAAASCLFPFLLSPGASAAPAAAFGRGVSVRMRPPCAAGAAAAGQRMGSGRAAAGQQHQQHQIQPQPHRQPHPHQHRQPPSHAHRQPQPLRQSYRRKIPKCGAGVAIRASKKFCKIPILDCRRGAEVPIQWTRPLGFFGISTHDREQLRGRQATSRPTGHPPQLRTTLGHLPPSGIAAGRQLQRAAPIAQCHRQHA
jgi:hypothetical protein